MSADKYKNVFYLNRYNVKERVKLKTEESMFINSILNTFIVKQEK